MLEYPNFDIRANMICSDWHTILKACGDATIHLIYYNRTSLDREIGDASRTVTDVRVPVR